MKYEMSGIIMVTGPVNVGKTSFCHPPGYKLSQIALANFDTKEPDIAGGKSPKTVYGFYKNYIALLAEKKETEMVTQFLNDMEKLPPTIRILILDGEETFRKSFTPYMKKHKAELQEFWYGRGGKFAVMEELGFSSKFEALFFSKLQERFDMIFVVNHLIDARDETSDEEMKPIIPGKKVASIKQPLAQKAKARFWIVPSEHSLCPSAIVIKNPGLVIDGENGFETVTYLPPKLSPSVLPDLADRSYVSLWDVIGHYQENPFSKKYPHIESYEMVTPSEAEMVSEDITDSDKQRIAQYALILQNQKRIKIIDEVESAMKEKPDAPELIIWLAVKKVIPDVTAEEVSAVIRSMKGE